MSRPFVIRRLYCAPAACFLLYLWEGFALLSLFGTLSRKELLFDPAALWAGSGNLLLPVLLCALADLVCALFWGKEVCVLTPEGVRRGNRCFPWGEVRAVLWQSHTPQVRGPWGHVLRGEGGSALIGEKKRMGLPHLPLWGALLLRRRAPEASLLLGGNWPLILLISQLLVFGVAALFTFSF